MPTPVLATKLFAPPARPGGVVRSRLLEQLDATGSDGHRLTLLSAPAGSGKTTLLSDWLGRRTEGRADRRVDLRSAWVSLDDADNALGRFGTHLVAALRRAGMPLDDGIEELFDSAPGSAAAVLVNDVLRCSEDAPGRRWVVVLDDYHVITAAEVHDLVAFLLDQLTDRLHLVLTTRADPPLPLPRLRSRGQLVELRAADLRFTEQEADAFLNGMMALDLTASDVAALGERTEGWVAGLQLAALSLRGVDDRDRVTEFIDAFTGSNRFVVDYLVDEVLSRQPPDLRDFLLSTAPLSRLSASLCDAVTGRTDGARTLEHLDRSNLFVVPLDDDRVWYRYHHLFADVLHARLLAEQPDRPPLLHRRASDWFAAHGLVTEAVDHALAAGDHERAAGLFEQALPQLRRSRQDALMRRWVEALPEPVVRRSPVLSIVAGWARLMTGELDGAESRFDDAEALLDAGAADPAVRAAWVDTEDLRAAPAAVAIYRASLAQARGDVGGTVRHAERALRLAGPTDHFLRGAGGGFLGLAAYAAGDVHGALSTFGTAVEELRAAGNLVDALDATIVLADMWVVAGRPSRARRLYDEGLRTATAAGRAWHPRATPDLHVGLAELDREADDLDGAAAHLATAERLRKVGSITENRHRWFQAAAWHRVAQGDHVAAVRLLDEAEALYRPGFYPDIRPVAAMRARIQVLAGDLDAASRWADGTQVTLGDHPSFLAEYEHLTLVRLLLARSRRMPPKDRRAQLAGVVEHLGRLLVTASGDGRAGSVREILLLTALAHDACGDRTAALEALERSFAEVPEPRAHVRLYLDEGVPLRELLGHTPTADAHLRWLLTRVERPDSGTLPEQPLPDALSDRELEVLRLLDTELSGPEIARELYVSVNTFRTHTKRIFTKLDVSTRAAAVRRAREIGLV